MRRVHIPRRNRSPANEWPTSQDQEGTLALPTLPPVRHGLAHPLHLLATQLRVPHSHQKIVPRPRLMSLLSSAVQYPLTLVCAPAGFGKTTLLAEWAKQSDWPVAWVSLTGSENDPVRFWAYFLAATQKVKSGLGEEAQSLLRNSGADGEEAFLIALLNELSAMEQEFVFVLDDYHLIESNLLHQAMAFLVERLPERMHLLIASRTVPLLPLARLRERGQLAELGPTDLSFNLEETAAFFGRQGSERLSIEQVSLLHAKTEGWVGALRLAASSLERQQDASDFIQHLTGSDRFIADYLVEEVLQQQHPNLQDFMLQTSILDRLWAPLCDSILDAAPGYSQARLEELERANLFLVTLDHAREWYRYNLLFADLLRTKLHQYHPELVPALYQRASLWFEQNGWNDEAVEMALAGQDFQRAAALIKVSRDLTVMQSDTSTLLRRINALPIEVVRSHPRLSLAKARALVPLGRVEEAEACLEDAEGTIRPDLDSEEEVYGAHSILGQAAAIRALIATTQYDASRIIAFSRQALDRLPADHRFLRGLVTLGLGVAHLLVADLPQARDALTEAVDLHVIAGNVLLTFLDRYYLAAVASLEGKFHDAADILRDALEAARTKTGAERPIAGLAHIALAHCLYRWNDLEGAIEHATRGLELSHGWWVRDAVYEANLTLARAYEARGDSDAALDARSRACELWNANFTFPFVGYAGIPDIQLWTRTEDASKRFQWVEASAPSLQTTGGASLEKIGQILAAANVLFVIGKLDHATRLLEPLPDMLQARRLNRHLIETQVLRALLYSSKKSQGQAMLALGQALELAEPEGLVRVFVDEGAPMLALLMEARQRGVAPSYVDQLLGAFGERARYVPAGVPALVEPLSARELEILSLMGSGLSPREAAQELTISVGTVRNHLKSIYAKLQVHNRVQAIQRAKESGLL